MALSTNEQILIEQRIQNDSKNITVAYLLAIFFGLLGAHRFYLGRVGTGIAMLVLSITLVGMIVSAIWAIVDLFLIPGMIREDKDRMRQQLTLGVLSSSETSGVPRSGSTSRQIPRQEGKN